MTENAIQPRHAIPPVTHLIVTLRPGKELELGEFAAAMIAVNDEWRQFLVEQNRVRENFSSEGQLLVADLRHGSGIVELVPPLLFSLWENHEVIVQTVKNLADFSDYLKAIWEWVKGTRQPPAGLAHHEKHVNNIEHINGPVLRADGGKFVIQINNPTFNISANNSFNTVDAREINTGITRTRQTLKRRPREDRTGVSLKWYQARKDPDAQTGHKAIVQEISPRAVTTVFANDIVGSTILRRRGSNPFRQVYNVDLTVEKDRQGRLKRYIINGLTGEQADGQAD